MAAKKDNTTWTAPSGAGVYDPGNIGAFVQASYGKNPTAASRMWNRLRKQKASFLKDPVTGDWRRANATDLAASPEGWGSSGVEGGSWLRPGNLNSSEWQIATNKAGRYFWRRPKVEDSLNPSERSFLTRFDEQAAAAVTPVNQAYDTAKAEAQTMANQVRANNANAASVIGQTSSNLGPAQGVADPNRSANDAAAARARQTAATQSTVNYFEGAPTRMATQKASALGTLATKTADSRATLLGKLAASVAERQMATAKNANDLRAAQLRYLGVMAGLKSDQAIADANNANDLSIANLNNANDLAVAGAAAGGRAATDANKAASAYNTWSDSVAKALTAQQVDVLDPTTGRPKINSDGTKATKLQRIPANKIVSLMRRGFNRGYNAAQVWNAVGEQVMSEYGGNWLAQDPASFDAAWNTLYGWLVNTKKMKPNAALQRIKKITGITNYQGRSGPPSP